MQPKKLAHHTVNILTEKENMIFSPYSVGTNLAAEVPTRLVILHTNFEGNHSSYYWDTTPKFCLNFFISFLIILCLFAHCRFGDRMQTETWHTYRSWISLWYKSHEDLWRAVRIMICCHVYRVNHFKEWVETCRWSNHRRSAFLYESS